MSKKKRFGISDALTRGLSETINVVENNLGVFRNVVLPLSRIELDPDNPRKLSINLQDIRQGIQTDDPLYQQKLEELEKLKELAHTITSSGVINPIIAYKSGEFYRIVAGERRCLASILAGKQEIEARVFNEKPTGFNLKLIQWIENTAREDLTLFERLENIKDIIQAYKAQHHNNEITATILKTITGLSLSQSTYYLTVLNASTNIQLAIKNGDLKNLDKAAFLANINTSSLQQSILEACIHGATLKEMRQMVTQQNLLDKKMQSIIHAAQGQGRKSNTINMGKTSHAQVVKTIASSVLSKPEFIKHAEVFKKINWDDFKQASKAFKKLIEILELELAIK